MQALLAFGVALALLAASAWPAGLASPVAAAGGEGRAQAPTPIVPALQALLARSPEDEPIPVIVRVASTDLLGQILAAVPGLAPEARFWLVPGFAARLTPAQIRALEGLQGVVRIEPDPVIHATLDGATHWFGTSKARRDFGLDGDRDGDPRRYTPDDVVIAVIDTGIDPNHVDLDGGKVIGWFDAVNDRPEPYDDHFHGTHVASIAAGEGDGNPAHAGVAPGAALVGIKVLRADGTGQGSDLIEGIQWAIENKDRYGIEILNMSLGTSQPSDGRDALSEAINRAVQAGLIAVVAAGNSGPAAGTVGAPGAAERAITVGAMADPSENGFALAWFSSRGPTQDGRIKPDVVAPGWGVTAAKAGTRAEYATYSGTSMATPFVSGTVALMLDANPRLSPDEVKAILHETAVDWTTPGPDPESGWGRLDGYAAIAHAAGRDGTPPPVPAHRVIQGTLGGWGRTAVEYPLEVADPRYPIGITLIATRHQPYLGPDLNLYLLDPSGQRVAESVTDKRQETIRYRPAVAGTYRIRVEAASWLLEPARFVIDVSAGLPGTPPPGPPSPPGDRPPAPPAPPAPERLGQLDFQGRLAAGGTAEHAFGVAAAGVLHVTATARQGTVDLRVLDADGRQLARLQAGGDQPATREQDLVVTPGRYRLVLTAPAAAEYALRLEGRSRQVVSGQVAPGRSPSAHRFEVATGGTAAFTLQATPAGAGLLQLTVRDSAGRSGSRLTWGGGLYLTTPVAPGRVEARVAMPYGWLPVSYRLQADLPAAILQR